MLTVTHAAVVEQVDTRDLKSLGGNSVPVQVRPAVPIPDNPNRTIHRIGDGFGFIIYLY